MRTDTPLQPLPTSATRSKQEFRLVPSPENGPALFHRSIVADIGAASRLTLTSASVLRQARNAARGGGARVRPPKHPGQPLVSRSQPPFPVRPMPATTTSAPQGTQPETERLPKSNTGAILRHVRRGSLSELRQKIANGRSKIPPHSRGGVI